MSTARAPSLTYFVECHRDPFLDLLLIFPYINNLPEASKLLYPIIQTYDDTNLFCLGKDIHSLFHALNNKL